MTIVRSDGKKNIRRERKISDIKWTMKKINK
jgi:hypothetical protein